MPLPAGLSSPKPLRHLVDHFDEVLPSGWLYIRSSAREIDLDTECFPVEIDSRDVSEEEMAAFEESWKAAGFKPFLCTDRIREIIGNLEVKQPEFTPADLGRAIDFYWRHDAFIVLNGDVA